MDNRLKKCISLVLCLALVVGFNPARSIALEASSAGSSGGSTVQQEESAAKTADSSNAAEASSGKKAEEADSAKDDSSNAKVDDSKKDAAASTDEKKSDGAADAAAAKDEKKSESEDAKSDDSSDKAPAASATKSAKASAVKTLASGEYDVMPLAGATYAAVTSDRDITDNLLNPKPDARFENPVGSGDYYTVDELKAKFGDDFKIYVGDSVWVKFTYSGLTNVQPGEALTFAIPDGLEGSEVDVKGPVNDNQGNEIGKYWLADGLLHMQFSQEYIDETHGNVSRGWVNFYGSVSEDAIEKEGISFGGHVIAVTGGHVGEDPNQKAAVKKWNGTPESTTETTYDAAKNAEQFTIEIDTAGNTKPVDIDVTDVVSFKPANVIDNNKAWTVETDEAAAAGLTTSFTKKSDGKYVWSIKQMPANKKFKLTYWVYLDSANSTGNFSFDNEATPAIGKQTFKPAKTDGMEQHQFEISKDAGRITYDPATGKATAAYTVKVTANANNSGTASNVSVVDTFKTGGKYVADVKQTSAVGTISDKKQSGDNYSFKWNIGSIAPGETKTLTYTAEFDANTLYFGDDQGSKDRKDINNEAKVYEGADTTPRAQASAYQRVDNQQATKGYEFDTATGKLKFTIIFNGKIPGTNKYFDSVLTNFTDQILTAGVTYADDTPVLEAFTDAGVQKTAALTDANIAGKSSFNIVIPSDMKGPYSYRLTYYVNVPAGIDPSTVIRNTMAAQGVGINGDSPFSLSDEASATVAGTYAASLSKGVNYAQVLGPEGEYDRIEWNLTLTSPVPAGATITDVADNWNKNFPNVFNNGDMMDPDVTKLCIMNGKSIASTLERGVDYDLTWQGSQMVLTFLKPVTGISKDNPLRFFYRTQLVPTDDMYASMSQPAFPKGDSDHSFNGLDYCSAGNKAELNVNGMTATADNRTTVNGGFEKYNGAYDSKTREIQWKAGLYYNSHNGYVIQGKRTITENIAEDQVISRVTDPSGNEVPYTVSADGRTVTFEVDWSPNNQNDFVYVYTKLNEQYLIEHGQDPDNLVDYEAKNTASIDAFGTQVAVGATAKVTETGTLTKDYTYSHVTEGKGGIEFALDVNPNASDLDPGSDTLVIQDIMNRNLVLDPDSVLINGQTVADFGQNAELRYDKNSNHFQLVLPDGVACKVTYLAKVVGVVAGEDGWLSNTARIEGRPGTATVDKTSTKRLEVGAGAFKAVPFFVKKMDGDQNLVSGATFELKRLELKDGQLVEADAIDTEGEVVTTSNDNLDGTYRWINLLPTTPEDEGSKGYVYVIRETAAPTGCELDTTPKYVYFEEPSQEMTDAMTAAGMQATKVKGGGGNNIKGMFSVSDENKDDKVSVKVNKVWNDEDNAEGFRPNEITINLIRDHNVENPAQTVQVKAGTDGNWSYTFTDLDKYETVGSTRHECAYTVTEDAVPEYTTVVSGSAADGYTVTNSHTVAKTSISGLKFWNDDSNAAGKRPEKITVGVFADGSEQPVATQEITAAGNASAADSNYWTYTFDNLNKYKNDGKRTPIVYTVKEIGSIAGYEAEQTGAADNNYTIKNKFVGKTIYVDKVDDEGNPVPGAELMVESVNGDGDDGGDDEGGLDVEALDDGATTTIDTWTTDGTKHELTLAPGNYVLSEANAPAGYEKSDPIYFTVNDDGTVTITGNTGAVSGDDLNIVTMTDVLSTVKVTFNKTWNDKNNVDGKRPNVVKVQLKADGVNSGTPVEVTADAQGNWTYEFKNLPKVKVVDGKASDIVYTVEEVDLDANYTAGTPDYTTDNKGNVTAAIENKHDQETVSVSGTKTWNDSSNQDGVRPANVTIGVFDDDDLTTPVQKATLSENDADAVNKNVWKYSFIGLPKYKNAGTEITYVVRELDADDSVIAEKGKNGVYEVAYSAEGVTNTYTPGKVSVPVEKKWTDDDNRDGKRPGSVQVQLKADGQAQGDPVTITPDGDGNWKHVFADLPAKNAGQDIAYTVEEVDKVDGYTAEVTGSAANGYTITNTHQIETTKVEGKKIWDDKSNQDGKRPGTVKIDVYDADDMNTVVKSVEVTAPAGTDNADEWSYSVTGLPKNKLVDGVSKAITYTVKEANIDANYEASYQGNDVTNKHTSELTSISGTKTWDDKSNQDGKRPGTIHVKVMNGAKVAAEKDVTGGAKEGTWSYEFTGLPKYENGREITYTVSENAVDGYQTEYDGKNIKNSYTPGKKSVSVTKIWEDANNQDGKRPTSIKLQLKADGVNQGDPVEVKADGNGAWSYTFSDLDQMKDGQVIKYTVEEQQVDDYKAPVVKATDEATAEGAHYAYTVTNARDVEKTEVSGTKVWADSSNQDGKRPAGVTLAVYDEDNMNDALATVDLNAGNAADDDNVWNYTFTNLDKNKVKDGKSTAIKYVVRELNTDANYTASYDGNKVTNTHQIDTVSVSGTKAWDDASDQDGKRPTSIKLGVFDQDNMTAPIKTAELNAEATNEWSYTFEGLDENKNGQPITYVVRELDANGAALDNDATNGDYKVAYDGNKVTNTHEVEKTSVTVTKKWNDRDNKEGKRPGSIQLQLMANGQAQGAPVTVNANDNGDWTYTFANLDKYTPGQQGQEAEYTVDELKVDQYNTGVITGTQKDGYTVTNNETARKVVINKVDDQGNPVPGAELKLEKADGADPEPEVEINALAAGGETWTTDGTGHELQLEPGTYVLTETDAPAGYDVADPIEFTVKDDGTVIGPEGTVSGADLNIVSMTDQFTVHTLNIVKTDAAGTPLAGAKLKVSGTEASGKAIEPIEWDSAADPQSIQLPMGSYTFEETQAPAGYDAIDPVKFTVSADGKMEIVDAGATVAAVDEQGATLTAADQFTPFETSFSKVNIGGQPVEGAQIVITGTNAAGQEIEPIAWTTGTEPHKLNLPMGEYVFHEEAAPNGYTAVTDITFKVDEQGKIVVTDTESNAMEVAEDGTAVITDQLQLFPVSIKKVDEDGKMLEGAQLEVTGKNAAGQEIKPIAWKSGKDAKALELAMGGYTLTEKKVPDAKKYQLAKPISFVVNEKGEIVVTSDSGVKNNGANATVTMVDKFSESTGGGGGGHESSTPGSETPGGDTPGQQGKTPGGDTPGQGGKTPGGDTPGGTTPGGNTPGYGTSVRSYGGVRTGDAGNLPLFLGLLGIAGAGILVAVRRRNGNGRK